MSKYRSLQFLRNQNPVAVANYEEAMTNFKKVSLENVQDGEIILYSYTITGEEEVHTLVGVVREQNGKYLEILGNYDFLHQEIVNALDEAKTYTDTTIDALDTSITNHVDGGKEPVIVTITQTDGLLTSVTVDVKNLSDNFQEIINALDYTHAEHFTQATDNKSFKIYATNQVDGQISEEVDGTIYFTDGVTETNPGATKKYVDDKIAELDTPEGGVSSEADQNILVTVEQTDGKVTTVSVNESALNARLEAIENNTITGKEAIVVTPDTTTGNNEVSLKIADGEKVLSQSDAGLKSTISLSYDSATTTIYLKGIDGADLGTVDAKDFVVDGMLSDAEVITATEEDKNADATVVVGDKYIKLTFITKYHDKNDETIDVEKVVYIAAESLVDAYTAGNDWIVIDTPNNTISHKEVKGLDSENTHGSIERKDTGVTGNDLTNAGESIQLAVPIVEVDAAGHVTRIDEYTTIITLPASIATAVQTVKSTEAVNAIDKFVAVHATRTGNDVVLTSEVKTKEVATASATDNGVALAADVKQFVLDNSASVTATTGETTVAKSTEQPYIYTVGLADVVQTNNTTATSSFADTNNTFTFVKDVNVDAKGRVIGIVTETVTEDFDMGFYE